MPFQIIRNDITKVKADAIVNTANPKPTVGSGTDSAVYTAAGEAQLLSARKKIGDIAPGEARSTEAFRLEAKYIIHTVGPVWINGERGEREILRSCYENSLLLADTLKCRSIAFPLIASGAYGFPKDEALNIALSEIGKFLLTHEMKVILVVFDRTALQLSERLVGEIEQYIDDHSVRTLRETEYVSASDEKASARLFSGSVRPNLPFHGGSTFGRRQEPEETCGKIDSLPGLLPDVAGKSLEEVLNGTGQTFQQRLFALIDASGMDDVTVYKKANIDRKVFSSIRCKKDYKPKKKTALAFAIALKLDLPTTLDLLSRAEIAFSPSSRFDLIVTYFIQNGIYDIFEINAALFRYGQPILGE